MPNRIIKDSIWTSPSINRLSINAERHFYRLLPLPDDHGCFQSSSSVVKGLLYPLQDIKTKDIEKWHTELEEANICRFWIFDGREYGIFINWAKHQRIRSVHQRKTPPPPENILNNKLNELDVNCRQLSSIDRLNPNPNPNPNALSKDKAVASPPVFPSKLQYPGSKHYSNKLLTATVEEIDKACRDIKDISRDSPKGNGFNPYSFVQEAVNKTQHPSAILEALAGLIKIWPTIDIPYRWGWSIIKTKSGNYNESDHRKQTEEFKKEWNKFAKEAFG